MGSLLELDSASMPSLAHGRHQHPRLVLVRHAAPAVEQNVHPSHWHLSKSGWEAAKSLGEILRSKKFVFERIVCSPAAKAIETAKAISSGLGEDLVAVVDSDLSEHKRRHATREEFETGIARLLQGNPSELVFGEETADAAIERFTTAIQKEIEHSSLRGEISDTMIVSHGTILSLYVGRNVGIDSLLFWRRLKFPVAVVIYDNQMEIIESPTGTTTEVS